MRPVRDWLRRPRPVPESMISAHCLRRDGPRRQQAGYPRVGPAASQVKTLYGGPGPNTAGTRPPGQRLGRNEGALPDGPATRDGEPAFQVTWRVRELREERGLPQRRDSGAQEIPAFLAVLAPDPVPGAARMGERREGVEPQRVQRPEGSGRGLQGIVRRGNGQRPGGPLGQPPATRRRDVRVEVRDAGEPDQPQVGLGLAGPARPLSADAVVRGERRQIGRASCRERV